MFLHTGLNKFARTHNLEVCCLVNFKWEGSGELRVKAFDDTSRCTQYHDDDIVDELFFESSFFAAKMVVAN
jgi:hypothetical protein